MSSRIAMLIGSLCSGYGGLDLGLMSVVGGSVAWHAEYDENPSKILAHHWPGVPNLRDITAVDWSQVERVDWLTAGYPCQPFSLSGKRKGVNDERHLWPYVAAAIGALRPGGVLLENVAGHLSLGFGTVLGDLARLGYDARWGVVRASEAGAPHRRARVFIVAQDTDGPVGRERWLAAPGQTEGRRAWADAGGRGGTPAADADQPGCPGVVDEPATTGRTMPAWGTYGPAIRRWETVTGRAAPRPTQPGRTGQRLSPRFVEWLMGLPVGHVTEVPGLSRNGQLKALGNGVVPQQAALALSLLLPNLSREDAA